MLLEYYKVAGLKKSKDELVGECPICKAKAKRTFKANVVKNVFRCFTCEASGDIIAFVKAMENCATLADAGRKLREMFPAEIAGAEALAGGASEAPPQRTVVGGTTGLLCYLVYPSDDEQPTNERACDLLDTLPWIKRVSIAVKNGREIIEAVSFENPS